MGRFRIGSLLSSAIPFEMFLNCNILPAPGRAAVPRLSGSSRAIAAIRFPSWGSRGVRCLAFCNERTLPSVCNAALLAGVEGKRRARYVPGVALSRASDAPVL